MKTTKDNWYRYPQYYEIAMQSDTEKESDFVEQAAERYVTGPVQRLLEPACGSGRLVVELARRGYELTAFDLCEPATAYLRRRLKRLGLSAHVFEGSMQSFSIPDPPFDLAFNYANTFRHLLTEADARNHLQCVANHLRVGGIYILGLHLFPFDASLEDIERWSATKRGTKVTVTLRATDANLRKRLETIRTSVHVRKSKGEVFRIQTEFPLRIYRRRSFLSLLESVPAFEIAGVYDFWYELDHPIELTDEIADTVFVLRRKP